MIELLEVEDPIIVALDTSEWRRLRELSQALEGRVKTVKVGLETYTGLGPEVLDELRETGFRIFADLKLHDIPSTVRGAVINLVKRGVDMLTVHTSGGRRMMEEAVRVCRDEAKRKGVRPPAVLGVTVLTSLGQEDMEELGWTGELSDTVASLAEMAWGCGLDGFVASASEVPLLRGRMGSKPLIVTPGIRLRDMSSHDQARVSTPRDALSSGADYLVIGRAITEADDPLEALGTIREAAGMEGL